MKELHDGHLGVVKMKALARSYVWWPNISAQLEGLVKACSGCRQNQKIPTTATLHPWEWELHHGKHTHRLCKPIPELDVLSSCRCTQQVAGSDLG